MLELFSAVVVEKCVTKYKFVFVIGLVSMNFLKLVNSDSSSSSSSEEDFEEVAILIASEIQRYLPKN